MSDQETTRRDTLKLAAAVAAFGAALGYRPAAEGADKTELKTELKRFEVKFYDGTKLVHTCSVPPGQLKQIKHLEVKLFTNDQVAESMGWDVKANKKM